MGKLFPLPANFIAPSRVGQSADVTPKFHLQRGPIRNERHRVAIMSIMRGQIALVLLSDAPKSKNQNSAGGDRNPMRVKKTKWRALGDDFRTLPIAQMVSDIPLLNEIPSNL
jgi:hypothetical protein